MTFQYKTLLLKKIKIIYFVFGSIIVLNYRNTDETLK
jgi:hypothetical protein